MTVLDPMHRLRTALESPMRPAPHRLALVSAKDGSCMHARYELLLHTAVSLIEGMIWQLHAWMIC